jgi:hypothetical protein
MILENYYLMNVPKYFISKYFFLFSPLFIPLGKAPMPRPGYKPQEPNGCSSYFLGLKIPGSVGTATVIFLIDGFSGIESSHVIRNLNWIWRKGKNFQRFLTSFSEAAVPQKSF